MFHPAKSIGRVFSLSACLTLSLLITGGGGAATTTSNNNASSGSSSSSSSVTSGFTIPTSAIGSDTGLYLVDIQASFPAVDWANIDRLYIPAGNYKFIRLGNSATWEVLAPFADDVRVAPGSTYDDYGLQPNL